MGLVNLMLDTNMQDNLRYIVALKLTDAPTDGEIIVFDECDDDSKITCYNVCLMTANCPDDHLNNVIETEGFKVLNVKVGPKYAKKQFPKMPKGFNGIQVDVIDLIVGCTPREEKFGCHKHIEMLQTIMGK
jgi:hypothetical protein